MVARWRICLLLRTRSKQGREEFARSRHSFDSPPDPSLLSSLPTTYYRAQDSSRTRCRPRSRQRSTSMPSPCPNRYVPSLALRSHPFALATPPDSTLLSAFLQLVGQADLQSYFPHTSLTDIGQAINNLSRKVRISLSPPFSLALARSLSTLPAFSSATASDPC